MKEQKPRLVASLNEGAIESGLYELDGQYGVTTKIGIRMDGEQISVHLVSPIEMTSDDAELMLLNTSLMHAISCHVHIDQVLGTLQAKLVNKIEERMYAK